MTTYNIHFEFPLRTSDKLQQGFDFTFIRFIILFRFTTGLISILWEMENTLGCKISIKIYPVLELATSVQLIKNTKQWKMNDSKKDIWTNYGQPAPGHSHSLQWECVTRLTGSYTNCYKNASCKLSLWLSKIYVNSLNHCIAYPFCS